MVEKKAYTQAVNTGKYDKATGLLGKYDNVRRFWEDQLTGIFIRSGLNELVERKLRNLDRIRVVDIGCGSGDAYDLIMGVTTKDPGIYDFITAALTYESLQEYIGVDINQDLLDQAEDYYGNNPKMRFVQGDICGSLPESVTREEPFDMYFTSYGTLSHFHDEDNIKLVADICRHAPDRAIFIGDWLGRYSYEWQELWHHPPTEEYFMDYRISYIYPEEERDQVEVASFPLRLMTRDEIMNIVNRASEEAGVQIKPVKFYDRSILIGRHLDTGDYNKNSSKIRYYINSLFESYVRTDLESVKLDYMPREGFSHLNNFFEMFYMSCNTLVDYTIKLLSEFDSDKGEFSSIPEIYPYYPEPLKNAMHTMRHVIEGVGTLKYGDVRANVIEPQLGYALRRLEIDLQPGTGMGHSLAGIFEIIKS
jgi:SAM-dependent methyltransferase